MPIAIGLLARCGLLSDDAREQLSKYEFIRELGLYGELRYVRGVLPDAIAVMHTGRTLIVPTENLADASLQAPWRLTASYPDLADVRGQESARPALGVAAAGGHNSILLVYLGRAIRCCRLGCRVCCQNLSLMQRPRWLTYIPQVMVDSTLAHGGSGLFGHRTTARPTPQWLAAAPTQDRVSFR